MRLTVMKMFQVVLIGLLTMGLLAAFACGTGEESSGVDDVNTAISDSVDATSGDSRIFAVERQFMSDDLAGAGLKSGKEYDVSTLPGGVESRLMYWRVNNVAVQYEVRFYESHLDAVRLGAGAAEEGSGEDAVLDDDVAEYVEGIRDRRTVFDFRGVPRPRYGAYAIYGNMVVLCEGRDDAEAWMRCSALIEVLD